MQGLEPHSQMLTSSVRIRRTTEGGLFPTYTYLSKHLKNPYFYYFYWDLSSAGEHMTEDHGVRGSTPRGPILNRKVKTFINKF